jgi:prevent-host-death family protein
MLEVNVKEARRTLSSLLDKVEAGEEIILTRRGNKVACLVPPKRKKHLPSLHAFRRSLQIAGKSVSKTVINMREEARY